MRRGNWYREPQRARGFEPARPRPVAGGIKADLGDRARFKSWWARRWIEVLEQFGHGPRLSRGRSYARSGQVRSLIVRPGELAAVVQGSQPDAYDVAIRLPTIAADLWRAAVAELPGARLAAAQLLSGEVGAELEAAFRAAGASLLPQRPEEIVTQCNCSDGESPCKHVAAVHYVFGAELERDPFLLFALRGIDRGELLAALAPPGSPGPPIPVVSPEPPERIIPLPCDPDTFFRAGPLPPIELASLRVPPLPAAHLRPLGSLPFWRGREPLVDALAPIYRAASELARALTLGGESRGEG